MEEDKNYRHIVRIVNTDLNGAKSIYNALRKIKGVGFMYSNAVLSVAGIPKAKKCGTLSDAEAKQLDEIIRNPAQFDLPTWLFNRKRDYETNEDMHVLTTDLDFAKGNDIKRIRKIKCYRGVRHSAGLPVRGQRTRSNFRRNKGKKGGSLGVQKKKPGKK
ncbi:30S ribosomal protein S13 [Candidatus Woesearchaeota archaeon CG11_big_fil_rev_8_21_14_0_20_43_8]|nr:MAG: 30S ribosomal protein S13 [Candidatus Woesearchaeota archaeon CG11_big_fil_rev_8_21_14_0_20_43_8]PIO06696.1 MAG: 30S ribosomal protein S13 [Candidatus Woesearchaeota archaeon CG08_land_8_20_14_0_20_43_7]